MGSENLSGRHKRTHEDQEQNTHAIWVDSESELIALICYGAAS